MYDQHAREEHATVMEAGEDREEKMEAVHLRHVLIHLPEALQDPGHDQDRRAAGRRRRSRLGALARAFCLRLFHMSELHYGKKVMRRVEGGFEPRLWWNADEMLRVTSDTDFKLKGTMHREGGSSSAPGILDLLVDYFDSYFQNIHFIWIFSPAARFHFILSFRSLLFCRLYNRLMRLQSGAAACLFFFFRVQELEVLTSETGFHCQQQKTLAEEIVNLMLLFSTSSASRLS